MELSRRRGGEVINADAYQIYEGLDILTAKPSRDELAAVPHRLFSTLPSGAPSDAGRYLELANAEISAVSAEGKLPVVVGGSGLYIKALTHGLSALPRAQPHLRAALETLPLSSRFTWLTQIDPTSAATIDPANPRYVDRALEIALTSGERASDLRATWGGPPHPGSRGIFLHFNDRDALYRRIDARVHAMVKAGALEEVRDTPGRSKTAACAIGYREFSAHLRGENSLDDAIAEVQQASRRYAKRQLTWFRKETWMQTILVTEDDDAGTIADSVLRLFPDLSDEHPLPH